MNIFKLLGIFLVACFGFWAIQNQFTPWLLQYASLESGIWYWVGISKLLTIVSAISSFTCLLWTLWQTPKTSTAGTFTFSEE